MFSKGWRFLLIFFYEEMRKDHANWYCTSLRNKDICSSSKHDKCVSKVISNSIMNNFYSSMVLFKGFEAHNDFFVYQELEQVYWDDADLHKFWSLMLLTACHLHAKSQKQLKACVEINTCGESNCLFISNLYKEHTW